MDGSAGVPNKLNRLSEPRRLRAAARRVYGDPLPARLPAAPLRIAADWNRLRGFPFARLLSARARLFRERDEVRDLLSAGHADHVIRAWESDSDSGDSRDSFVGAARLDCVVTPEGRVFCNELDLLPGGPGIAVALEEIFLESETPTLDAYCRHLEAVGIRGGERLALVTLSTEDDLPYLPERAYLAERCRARGLPVWAVAERELDWRSDGPYLSGARVTHVDRFYCGWQLAPGHPLWRLRDHGVVEMPSLAQEVLEAKLWDAVLWDPRYSSFWESELGPDLGMVRELVPETHLLDERCEDLVRSLEAGSGGRDQEIGPQGSQWILKEGAAAVVASWGSRSVRRVSSLPRGTLEELLRVRGGSRHAVPALGRWQPVLPILQRFVASAPFEVPLIGGASLAGSLRWSPFAWLHPAGPSVSRGLATVRASDIVHDAADAVMTLAVGPACEAHR